MTLGATAPVMGGTFYAQASYLDSETEADVSYEAANVKEGNEANRGAPAKGLTAGLDATNWGIALGYAYPFSKRTTVYTYASYNELKMEVSNAVTSQTEKTKQTEVGFGLVHKF